MKAYAQIASNRPGIAVPAEAMAALEAALHDDSPVVAITAVMALGQVGSQALPLLLQVCRGKNEAQAVAAVTALAGSDHPDVAACFLELSTAETTDPYVLETVMSSLARVADLRLRQA